jgi:hypothetical protein
MAKYRAYQQALAKHCWNGLCMIEYYSSLRNDVLFSACISRKYVAQELNIDFLS